MRSATTRNFIFSQDEPVLRYDHLLPYNEINPEAGGQPTQPSPYMIGHQRDTLKIQIIILPQKPYRNTGAGFLFQRAWRQQKELPNTSSATT